MPKPATTLDLTNALRTGEKPGTGWHRSLHGLGELVGVELSARNSCLSFSYWAVAMAWGGEHAEVAPKNSRLALPNPSDWVSSRNL